TTTSDEVDCFATDGIRTLARISDGDTFHVREKDLCTRIRICGPAPGAQAGGGLPHATPCRHSLDTETRGSGGPDERRLAMPPTRMSRLTRRCPMPSQP